MNTTPKKWQVNQWKSTLINNRALAQILFEKLYKQMNANQRAMIDACLQYNFALETIIGDSLIGGSMPNDLDLVGPYSGAWSSERVNKVVQDIEDLLVK